MLGLHKDAVALFPYDPTWKQEFQKEKTILQKLLKDFSDISIEHVGSTSIPGLSAKPIIDISLAVKDEQTMLKINDCLAQNGYDMLNNLTERGEILARKGPPECRTHYIHMEIYGGQGWINHIHFRNYLLKHPEYIEKYEKLKNQLVALYSNERKKYTAEKSAFIQNILELAKKEFN